MIYAEYIDNWHKNAPWPTNEQAEQDLIICRCLVAIYNDDFLASQLAFRGGTALHKLFFHPQPRFSEDIDLVQIHPGPIKPILQRLGEVLSFLPDKVIKQRRHSNSFLFRIDSEIPPVIQIRLKIEINCCEHFNVLGLIQKPFSIENQWFHGNCQMTTYHLEELLGTKFRALYQRRKGRDLFDLYYVLTNADVDIDKILLCHEKYISFTTEQPPSYRQFIANMEEKMQNPEFTDDTTMILRPNLSYNPHEAYAIVREKLIERLLGRR